MVEIFFDPKPGNDRPSARSHGLRIFVYGSLKRGFAPHDRFCGGVMSVEEGTVRGRLFEMPEGYPVLWVPTEEVLADGTDDPVADVEVQRWYQSQGDPRIFGARRGSAETVLGEILTFGDPENRLPLLDEYEGFRPGKRSFYRRVLVRAELPGGNGCSVWTYVAGGSISRFKPIPAWPPPPLPSDNHS